MMPGAAVISNWFMRSHGAAMGIISAGSSLSAFLFYPLNAWLIASFGWRHALDVFGLIILLGVGPLGALLYRRHPSDVGAVPYGMQLPAREPEGYSQPTATRTRGRDFTDAFLRCVVIGTLSLPGRHNSRRVTEFGMTQELEGHLDRGGDALAKGGPHDHQADAVCL